MKIAAIADLHGNLPKIPKCDILLIGGDICPHMGTEEWETAPGQIIKRRVPVGSPTDLQFQANWLETIFRKWIDSIPAKEVVAVFGNHDFVAEKLQYDLPKLRWHVLFDDLKTVMGLKIWGSPYQNWFYDWAFNAPPGEEGEIFLKAKYDTIPEDIDIIISHGPPYGYGDETMDHQLVGSKALLEAIHRTNPGLLITGHIHNARGTWAYDRSGNKRTGIIANATVLDERYDMIYKPMVFGKKKKDKFFTIIDAEPKDKYDLGSGMFGT